MLLLEAILALIAVGHCQADYNWDEFFRCSHCSGLMEWGRRHLHLYSSMQSMACSAGGLEQLSGDPDWRNHQNVDIDPFQQLLCGIAEQHTS